MVNAKKILVVGAGVAGPLVCYWLKRFGFSPVLIERSPGLRKGGQALDIRGIAVDVVKKMGIYSQIYHKRTRLETGCYVDTRGNTLHEEQGDKAGFRQGEDVEILRGDLVEILMQALEDIPCYFNRTIDEITSKDDNVKVSFNDGIVEHYDLIIAADGIHSTIRQIFFDVDDYKLVNLGAYISIFSIPNYLHLRHTEVLCESDEKFVSITSDNDFNIAQAGFMFRSQYLLSNIRDETEQKQFLHDTFHNFGWEAAKMLELMQNTNDFYFDSITQVKMDTWTKERVALVGDAGYCASPLSGQGTSLALVGAYILAGEIKAAKEDYRRAFSRYNELMRPFVDANQQFGFWVSKSFFAQNAVSKELAAERANTIMQMLQAASKAIVLPEYTTAICRNKNMN